MEKRTFNLKSKKHLVVLLCVMILVIGFGYLLLRSNDSKQNQIPAQTDSQAETVLHDGTALAAIETMGKTLYACPMNCVPPMEKPGRCPVCGMDLVPVSADEHEHQEGPPRIQLSEETIKAAGIQVAPVEEKFVNAEIRLFGKIEYDPVEQYKVTAFAPGVVDNIYVRRAGQVVRKGDPLFDLHSSELFFLEQEFFQVLKQLPYEIELLRPGKYHGRKRVGRWSRLVLPTKKSSKDGEMDADTEAVAKKLDLIHRKMMLLGLSEEDINGLIVKGRPTGISTVTTPMTGVVLEQNAFRGAYVNTGDVVFTIANPRVLWARLDAYASDFPWIRLGQEAEFETDAYPGETFRGKVIFLDPEFDPESRVFKVGVLYDDSRGLLKPNMLVRAVIHAEMTAGGRSTTELVTSGMMGTAQMKRTDKPPLVIPDTAPLITGKRAVVYVEVPGKKGTYEGREIELGPRAKGYYLVRGGLKKGEMVVVNGNFKIDSAVQILAKPSMMEPRGGKLAMGHQHQAKPERKAPWFQSNRRRNRLKQVLERKYGAGATAATGEELPEDQMESHEHGGMHQTETETEGMKPRSKQHDHPNSPEQGEAGQPPKGAQWEIYR